MKWYDAVFIGLFIAFIFAVPYIALVIAAMTEQH